MEDTVILKQKTWHFGGRLFKVQIPVLTLICCVVLGKSLYLHGAMTFLGWGLWRLGGMFTKHQAQICHTVLCSTIGKVNLEAGARIPSVNQAGLDFSLVVVLLHLLPGTLSLMLSGKASKGPINSSWSMWLMSLKALLLFPRGWST